MLIRSALSLSPFSSPLSDRDSCHPAHAENSWQINTVTKSPD